MSLLSIRQLTNGKLIAQCQEIQSSGQSGPYTNALLSELLRRFDGYLLAASVFSGENEHRRNGSGSR